MTHVTLLTLLVVLAGLGLRVMTAAPRSGDRRELNQQEAGAGAAIRKVRQTLEKLQKDGLVEVPLPSSDGRLVLLVTSRDSSESRESLDSSWKPKLVMDKRGPITNTSYTMPLKDEKTQVKGEPMSFDELVRFLLNIRKIIP